MHCLRSFRFEVFLGALTKTKDESRFPVLINRELPGFFVSLEGVSPQSGGQLCYASPWSWRMLAPFAYPEEQDPFTRTEDLPGLGQVPFFNPSDPRKGSDL